MSPVTIPCYECGKPRRREQLRKRKTDGVLICTECSRLEKK